MTDNKRYPELPQIDDATDEVIDLVSHECALSTAGGATVQTEWDEDDLYTVERAADLLEGYVEFIKREVTSVDIEAHPYLPEVEGVAKDLRTLAARPSPIAVVAEPTGWQPIETAPRDGHTLLLGYFNSHCNWRTLRGRWMSEDYIAEYWEEPEGVEPGWFETSVEADEPPNCWWTDPTHWQPLPPAPKE